MFSNKSKKTVPQTLSECIQEDATVTNLHGWAERLEKWGSTLFIFLIIIGIIFTISNTVEIADIDDEMVFSTLITTAATWGLYAFIEYCTYHVLALLISALASITQHTIISANVALYEAVKDSTNPGTKQTNPPGMEQSDSNDKGTSSTDNEWRPVSETTALIIGETNIKCANCNRIQFKGNIICNRCGARFIQFKKQ